MNIFNPFKREEYTKKFSKFWLERLYEQLNIPEDEYDVYVDDENSLSEIAYVIKDEALGKHLFDIIQKIKNYGKIDLEYSEIRIRKTVINPKEKVIFAFFVEVVMKDPDYHLDMIEGLIETVTFINRLSELGFGLTSLYDSFVGNNFYQIFCSLKKFDLDTMSKEEINRANVPFIIPSIHRRITNKSLRDVYSSDEKMYSLSDMTYSLDMFRMFYNYSMFQDTNIDILEVLKAERRKNYNFNCNFSSYFRNCDCKICNDIDTCFNMYSGYIVPSMGLLEDKCSKYEETDGYIIYNEGYKIYKNPRSSDFEAVKELYSIPEKGHFFRFNISFILYDINANFIGYKFSGPIKKLDSDISILLYKFDNENIMITTLWNLKKLLFDVKEFLITYDKSEKYTDSEFDIEKDIILDTSSSSLNLYFASDESFFRLFYYKNSKIKEDLVDITLKLFTNYFKEKCPKADKKTFFSSQVIKYLPPKFANILFKYINNESIDKKDAYYSFFVDFCENNTYNTCRADNIYYSKFTYCDKAIDYIFDYNLYEKFGVSFVRGDTIKLADGRTIYCLNKAKNDFSSFFDKVYNNNKSRVREAFRVNFIDEVNIVGIESIIYSQKIASNGAYYVVGYVSNADKGVPLSKLDFSKFSNKDFIKLALKVFVNYNDKYIDIDQIKVDSDFNIYVNLIGENIKLYKIGREPFAFQFLKKLDKDGITIPGMDLRTAQSIDFESKYKLEYLYESMNKFCDIHKIYYSSKDTLCPICEKTLYDVEGYNGKYGRVVFEDEYAKHYALNSELNLKVYKKGAVKLSSMEKIIDKMLKLNGTECSYYYKQELFLPYKKAIISSTREFIGYVYKRVNFAECKDLRKDFSNMRKLRSLITLCMQVINIRNKGHDFAKNPYGSLLFSTSNKGTIQIVNIDLLIPRNSKSYDANEAMLIDYVVSSLSDEAGMEEISASSLEGLESKLLDLKDNMTKFCSLHNIYYHRKYMVCPKCVPNFNPNTIKKNSIYLHVDDWKKDLKVKGEGGESRVYEYSDGVYAKIFLEDEDVKIELKLAIILKIFERQKILEELNRKYKNITYVLPKKIIIDYDKNSIRGYTLDEVDGYELSLLKNKEEVERLGFDREDIFEILIAAGEGIEHLHSEANIYIGDLNGGNILFDRHKNVYFIDFDGMGIDDIAPQVFTDGYIDPISQRNETVSKKDDWYSFAIQAFYYLTYTHPFNGIYVDKDTGEPLDMVGRMERRLSLIGNHGIEPPAVAEEWSWMSKDMLNAFYNIFEKENRENITPCLKRYYNKVYSDKYSDVKTFSSEVAFSKPKLITREISLFKGNCRKIINSISYLSHNQDGNENLVIESEEGFISSLALDALDDILDVKISADERFAFIVYSNKVICVNTETNEIVYEDELFQKTTLVVNGNTFYYSNIVNGDNTIVKLNFREGRNPFRRTFIRFQDRMFTKSFMTINNEKFVVVKNSNNNGVIYCNDIEYKKLPGADNTDYKVLYDTTRNEWLVINSDGFYTVIRSDGSNISQLDNMITNCNIENAVFANGNIYLPKDGGLYIISVKRSHTQELPCNVVTKNSKIIAKKSSFVFFDEKKAYEYTKN